MRIVSYFVILMFTQVVAFAEVNPITGSFMLKHTDLLTKEHLFPFKISRSYNHKILSVGVFGNKWCSNLDERISFAENGIIIKKCDQESWLLFRKNSDKIYVNIDSSEFIKPLDGGSGFVRFTKDKILVYNSRGAIVTSSSKLSPQKPHTTYWYNSDGLLEKVVHEKLVYEFHFDKDKRYITLINAPMNKQVVFKYDEKNNLIYSKDVWGVEQNYSYDSNNRITRLSSSENFADITYDADNKVISVSKSSGCESKISYGIDINKSTLKSNFMDSCVNKESFFSTERSPLFFKNRITISKQNRKPASYSLDSVQISPKWKQIRTSKSVWQYLENADSNITQIRETDLKTKQTKKMEAVYKDQKLMQLNLDKKGQINFVYNGDKLVSMPGLTSSQESADTFEFFTNFLKIKAGVN